MMISQTYTLLKGFLKCPEHNNSLTAYACRSHTGRLHHYYLCCKDKCKHRYRIQDVHESIEDILSTVSVSAQIVNLYKKTLEKLFEKDDYQRRDEIQKTKKELEKLELRKSNLQNDLMDRTITSHDYQEMKRRVEKDIVLAKTNSLNYNKKYHRSRFIFKRKSQCWRTSWNITGSQTVPPRRKYSIHLCRKTRFG